MIRFPKKKKEDLSCIDCGQEKDEQMKKTLFGPICSDCYTEHLILVAEKEL